MDTWALVDRTFLQNKLLLERTVAMFFLKEKRNPLIKQFRKKDNGEDFLLTTQTQLLLLKFTFYSLLANTWNIYSFFWQLNTKFNVGFISICAILWKNRKILEIRTCDWWHHTLTVVVVVVVLVFLKLMGNGTLVKKQTELFADTLNIILRQIPIVYITED